MNDELKKIKRKYGEKMMHLCRELFPTILETEGLLYNILTSRFAPSRNLYDDIVNEGMEDEFKNLIYTCINIEENRKEATHSPKELLKEAGYTLYECKTEKDIQSFKRYYKKDEELCTFSGGRLDRCYVFFAVKDNADKLRRRDFKYPKRQDEYGTSVISIQFTRGICNTLSIKNRYNHAVINPDATFNNDLDNIIEGLTNSFTEYYGFNINFPRSNFNLENYVFASNGKYYKYNYEIQNRYYCPGNLIIDNFKIDTSYMNERYIVLDYFILDLKEKRMFKYPDNNIHAYDSNDSFTDEFKTFDKAEIIKLENENRKITIKNKGKEDIIIVIDKNNRIIEYINNNMINTQEYFMSKCRYIKYLEAKNLKIMPDGFLLNAKNLKELNTPNVEKVGNYVLSKNQKLKNINLLKLKEIGDSFLEYNQNITELTLPNVSVIGNNFMSHNDYLERLFLPNVRVIGDTFLHDNNTLSEIILPNVREIGGNFLEYNDSLNDISLPNVEKIGSFFLANSETKTLSLPNVRVIGNGFLAFGHKLTEISLPNVIEIGNSFLSSNDKLKKISLPNVEKIGSSFLGWNEVLEEVSLSNVKTIEKGFLEKNKSLKNIDIPINVKGIQLKLFLNNIKSKFKEGKEENEEGKNSRKK